MPQTVENDPFAPNPDDATAPGAIPTPTIYQIKRDVTNAPFYFKRETMRVYGQTLRMFSVHRVDKARFLISAPMYDRSFTPWAYRGNSTRIYNALTKRFE